MAWWGAAVGQWSFEGHVGLWRVIWGLCVFWVPHRAVVSCRRMPCGAVLER